jgi:hypothetical protein
MAQPITKELQLALSPNPKGHMIEADTPFTESIASRRARQR